MVLVVAVGALLVALSAAAALATTTRWGTDGADWLYGTAGNDAIYGYGGIDMIYAGTGNDTIYAGTGAERVYGGPGDDFVSFVGGYSKDSIDCGPGFDTVKKQSGSAGTSLNVSARNCERTIF